MKMRIADRIRAAEVVLSCRDLDETIAFFADALGFQIEAISPADAPAEATMSGHGLRIRLERRSGEPGVLRLLGYGLAAESGGATELVAPNGTRIELVEANPPLRFPPPQPSFVLSRMGDDATWSTGRAGMRYRDLIPGRQGGRFLASHIRIPDGGPVPDYVHFHEVRFQMIYCYKGWVRLVYEDQGPPFVLEAGDCVLQPPRIRHRVLESSPGLEVIEVSSPAAHETRVDHELALPTPLVRRKRDFSGQRFAWHRAVAAEWRPCGAGGFEWRDLGIAAATGGLAAAHVARLRGAPGPARPSSHDAELHFVFLLRGAAALVYQERAAEELAAGDSFVVPAGHQHTLIARSADLELLEVSLPASDGIRENAP